MLKFPWNRFINTFLRKRLPRINLNQPTLQISKTNIRHEQKSPVARQNRDHKTVFRISYNKPFHYMI